MNRNVLFLSLTGALLLALTGCDSAKDLTGECDADIGAKFEALSDASASLESVSAEMKLSVFDACNAIAEDLGEEPVQPVGAAPTDEEVTAACDLASAGIDAEVTAGATIALIVEGGQCTIDASAQVSCEAKCDVSGECTPGAVEVRCEPGELSVVCEGECDVNAYCEADVAVACEGVCEGTCTGSCMGSCTAELVADCSATCEGTCDGTCSVAKGEDGSCSGTCTGACKGTCSATVSGNCTGSCSAKCEGTCKGSCKLDAKAECGASARCRGGCTGTATAPKCEGELTPPSCDIEADCQAGCDGQAKFKAECTEPKVTVVVTGTANAALQTTLEANYPALLEVLERAKLVGEATGDVAEAFGNVVEASASIPACIADFGADAAAAVSASVKAQASFSVSVSASASVQGSATSSSN